MALRDFNTPSVERPVTLNHEPIGNGSGLGDFHTVSSEEIEPNNTGKIVGALAVALMVGAGGIYAYTMSGHAANPAPMQQTAANLPAPPPAPPAAMTPPPAPEAAAPMAAPVSTPEPAPAPVTKSAAAEKPVKSAAAKTEAPISDGASVRMTADSQATTTSQQAAATPVTPAPAQQAAIPEPVSPTPNPSDVANANPQSSVSVPQGATTATDIPAQPQAVTPEQPAQPEAAAPAAAQPAQSAGQVAQ